MDSRREAVELHTSDRTGFPGGAPEVVRVRLLGGFAVAVGARTVGDAEWRLRKAKGLVKLLSLRRGHSLHRGQVMESLWPRLNLEAASNNLHQTLHAARRALGREGASHLRLRGEMLDLCPDGPLWVDVEAFEDAASSARRTREPQAYGVALDLYAGDLLPEDRYEDWAEDRRVELREAYLALLSELAVLHEERGDYAASAGVLRRIIGANPEDREARARLTRLYALAGESDAIVHKRAVPHGRQPTRSPAGPPRHNLPTPLTSFVGREEERVEIRRALSMTQLLTLTGLGGAGKTRLVLEVARGLIGAYPDGVWLAELASLSDGALVPRAVADAVGVRERPDMPLEEWLAEALKDRELLLVLDDCEHLADAAARVVERLLATCPSLKALATSRQPLGIAGEVVRPVLPLSLPQPRGSLTAEALERSEATRLFLDRASHRPSAFVPSPESTRAVAEICNRLDGIPLAVELAAARVGPLSVEQVAERLSDSLRLLTAGPRTAPPRQRTLRGALDWSHDLLGEPEKRLFGRLSVFAGGFSLEAAQAVGESDGAEDVLDPLSLLVDKSLVTAAPAGDGTVRYRLLEPVRQYARERLDRAGSRKAESVRRRHAAFFLELAERAAQGMRGPRNVTWAERLEQDHDNLRAALSWTLERGEAEPALRLCGALGGFWQMRGHLSEGRRWLTAALATGSKPPARVGALTWAGYLAWEQNDYEEAIALSEEGLALARELEDRSGVAATLFNLGSVAMFRREHERATALLGEAAALRRELGDTAGVARTLQVLGLVEVSRRDYAAAFAFYEESLALAREAEDAMAISLIQGLGALVALGKGDHERVKRICEEVLGTSRQLGATHTVVFALHLTAALAGAQKQPIRAARLWGAAGALRETLGIVLAPVETHHYGAYIDAARERLDETAWEAARTEGKSMSPEEAAEYVLSWEERAPSPTRTLLSADRSPVLSRREREIAALVARGLTNRRISEELAISERTVATYVGRSFRKLGLRSRAQLAAWATKRDSLP